MALFANKISKLPPDIRKLIKFFSKQLSSFLGKNLVGLYLHGSIAFPDYEPKTGDIDFYAVVKQPLTTPEIGMLDLIHRTVSRMFDSGSRLDGFYIPLSKTHVLREPKDLIYAAHGTIHRGGVDDAWALHREHFYRSAYIRLLGPKLTRIFPEPEWQSTHDALFRQIIYARSILDKDPWWSVLNMCRIVYSLKTGNFAVSKLAAAKWALTHLLKRAEWQPLIRAAIRAYHQTATPRDEKLLRSKARKFQAFATIQALAYSDVHDNRVRKMKKNARRAR